jgi:hypothetical protein
MAERTQRSNILLAFISLTAVIAVVSLIGFFTLGKGPEIIQGQAEADEYRVSGKVPARILELRVKEGDKVKAGDTLVILEAPDVMAKLSQAQAAEQAARAISEKAQRGTRREQLQAAFEMWQKAKAGVEIAEKSYNRVNRLFEQVKLSGCLCCLPSGVCAKVFHVSHFEFHFFIECRNKGVDFFSHSEVFQEIFAHIESHPHIIQSGDIHNRSTGSDQLAHFGEYFGHFTVGSSCEDGLIHVGRYLGNCSFGTFHLCGGSCFVFLPGAVLSHFVL